MNTYTSHKLVTAVPMTRLAYNDYRDWELPSDEDGTDAGYLVEYLDGGNPNHKDHKGYISWSPKAQFEDGYTLTPITYVERIRVELAELALKIDALQAFLYGAVYPTLPMEQRDLLFKQLDAMKAYATILEARLPLG